MDSFIALQESDNGHEGSRDNSNPHKQVQIFLEEVMQEVEIVMEDLSAVTQNVTVKLSSTFTTVEDTFDSSKCLQVQSFLDDIMERVEEQIARCSILTYPVLGKTCAKESTEPGEGLLNTTDETDKHEVEVNMEDLSALTPNVAVKLSSTFTSVEDTFASSCKYLQAQVQSFLDDIMQRVDEQISSRCSLLTYPVLGKTCAQESAEPGEGLLNTTDATDKHKVEVNMEDLPALVPNVPAKLSSTVTTVEDTFDSTCKYQQVQRFLDDVMERVEEQISSRCSLFTYPVLSKTITCKTTEQIAAGPLNTDNGMNKQEDEINMEDLSALKLTYPVLGKTIAQDSTEQIDAGPLNTDNEMNKREVEISMEDLSALAQNVTVKMSGTFTTVEDTFDASCKYLQAQVQSFLDDVMQRVDEQISSRCSPLTHPVLDKNSAQASTEQTEADPLNTINEIDKPPEVSNVEVKIVMNDILDNLKGLLYMDDSRSAEHLVSNTTCITNKADAAVDSQVCVLQHEENDDPECRDTKQVASVDSGFPLFNPSTCKRESTNNQGEREIEPLRKRMRLSNELQNTLLKLKFQNECDEDSLQVSENVKILSKVEESQNDCKVNSLPDDEISKKSEDKGVLMKKQIEGGEKDSLQQRENSKILLQLNDEQPSQNDCNENNASASGVVKEETEDKERSQETSMLLKEEQTQDNNSHGSPILKLAIFDDLSGNQLHHLKQSTLAYEQATDEMSKPGLTSKITAADVTIESTSSSIKDMHLQGEGTRKRTMPDTLQDPEAVAKKAKIPAPEIDQDHPCPKFYSAEDSVTLKSSNQLDDASDNCFEEKNDDHVSSQSFESATNKSEHGEEKMDIIKKSYEDQTVPSLMPPEETTQHSTESESLADTSLYPSTDNCEEEKLQLEKPDKEKCMVNLDTPEEDAVQQSHQEGTDSQMVPSINDSEVTDILQTIQYHSQQPNIGAPPLLMPVFNIGQQQATGPLKRLTPIPVCNRRKRVGLSRRQVTPHLHIATRDLKPLVPKETEP